MQMWLSKNPHAQNTAYNVNNGDVFRFEQVCQIRGFSPDAADDARMMASTCWEFPFLAGQHSVAA